MGAGASGTGDLEPKEEKLSLIPRQGFGNLSMPQNHLEGWALSPEFPSLRGWGWGLSICISNTHPGDAGAAGPGPTLRKPQHGDRKEEGALLPN